MRDNELRSKIRGLYHDPVIVVCFVGYAEMYSLEMIHKCTRIPRIAMCAYAMEREVATLVKLKYNERIYKITSVDDFFN